MNKDLIVKGMIFVTGAAVGSLVTWKVVKTKYEQLIQEEIDSVKEAFGRAEKVTDAEEPEEVVEEDEEDTDIYEEDYVEDDEEMGKPYIISPEEYGDCDYVMIDLTYYADGVVTNVNDKIIANVDELIGEESLEHFGEYEEDAIYVRNDFLQQDFEILRDYREFSEI